VAPQHRSDRRDD